MKNIKKKNHLNIIIIILILIIILYLINLLKIKENFKKTDYNILNGNSKEHLDTILNWIENDKKFGLIRPGDGEYHILINKTIKVSDNWTFNKGDIIKDDLFNALNTKNSDLYIGLSCNCCIKGKEIQEFYKKNFNISNYNRTYANIFVNSNYKKFINYIKNCDKKIYYVGPGKKETNKIKIIDRFIIDDTLVNNWNTERETITNKLFNWISNINNSIICISAGPITKIWIPKLLNYNNTNTYLDVGSSFDIFVKDNPNLRSYNTDDKSEDAQKVCDFNTL